MPTTKPPGKAEKPAQNASHQEDAQIHTPTPPPQTIKKLSMELRFQILGYLVPSDCVIEIRSRPNKYSKTSTSRLPSEARLFIALRLVDKEFYQIASALFYGRNRFFIGSGEYGSTETMNIQALQSFITCIPSRHIAQIRHLGIPLYLRPNDLVESAEVIKEYMSDGSRYVASTMIKKFTGVTNLLIFAAPVEPHGYPAIRLRPSLSFDKKNWRFLIKDKRVLAFVRLLLKHENLKEIIASATIEDEKVKEKLQSIVDNSEAAGRVIVSQRVRYLQQRPWVLKGTGRW